MGTAVVLGARLALRVCLYKKTSKVRNDTVNLRHLFIPPFNYVFVKRIARLKASQMLGSSKIQ